MKPISKRGPSAGQAGAHRSHRDPEGCGDLLVRELRPGVEEHDPTLFGRELREGGGDPWGDERCAQMILVRGGASVELGVNAKSGIELEPVPLCAAVVPEQIRGEPNNQDLGLPFRTSNS